MLYNFIRTGKRPVSQVDNEYIIRGCFEPCTEKVKAQLEEFFRSKRQAITFEFDDCKVTIERREE